MLQNQKNFLRRQNFLELKINGNEERKWENYARKSENYGRESENYRWAIRKKRNEVLIKEWNQKIIEANQKIMQANQKIMAGKSEKLVSDNSNKMQRIQSRSQSSGWIQKEILRWQFSRVQNIPGRVRIFSKNYYFFIDRAEATKFEWMGVMLHNVICVSLPLCLVGIRCGRGGLRKTTVAAKIRTWEVSLHWFRQRQLIFVRLFEKKAEPP